MPDKSAVAAVLAPGVALTGAVIYWANLQGRLDTIAGRVRLLNSELRAEVQGSARAASVARQVKMLSHRSHVLHLGVVLSVLALLGFLSSSAIVFVTSAASDLSRSLAADVFTFGLLAMGVSLLSTLWEMLWARRSLDEDIASSAPRSVGPPPA